MRSSVSFCAVGSAHPLGDRDEFFSLESVRATGRALEEAGHPVMLTILERRGHSYPRVAEHVNSRAWAFMHAIELDREPKLQLYDAGEQRSCVGIREGNSCVESVDAGG